ncbi:hypothetical protein Enr13x_60980 [Stieleria neptunia]|uniref:Uncharacterized protein n=1 Tax=Stieleria neptunia TaxID=2527979 RepID=A0A518HZB9_9BACT|nr:hypothetical protein Enr13x_60980 [Stieleria neptunia]
MAFEASSIVFAINRRLPVAKLADGQAMALMFSDQRDAVLHPSC